MDVCGKSRFPLKASWQVLHFPSVLTHASILTSSASDPCWAVLRLQGAAVHITKRTCRSYFIFKSGALKGDTIAPFEKMIKLERISVMGCWLHVDSERPLLDDFSTWLQPCDASLRLTLVFYTFIHEISHSWALLSEYKTPTYTCHTCPLIKLTSQSYVALDN